MSALVPNVLTLLDINDIDRFYIHGRSPHGYADTNMREMRDQLKKEANELTGRRGLEHDNDQQTFEVFIPPALRDQYNTVFANIVREVS